MTFTLYERRRDGIDPLCKERMDILGSAPAYTDSPFYTKTLVSYFVISGAQLQLVVPRPMYRPADEAVEMQ